MQRITQAVLLFCFVTVLANSTSAQSSCTSRFTDSLYADITKLSDVVYGQSTQKDGTPQSLVMDIYMATADTSQKRPVLVFAHSGSFTSGDKTEPAIVRLCHAFAARGYVTASINYRLSITNMVQSTGADFTLANYLATQDAKAAVHFFHMQRQTPFAWTRTLFSAEEPRLELSLLYNMPIWTDGDFPPA